MKEAELLYTALQSEYGIEIEYHGNYQVSLQRLYAARRADPDLEVIQICRSPTNPQTHLWLVKSDKAPPPQGGPIKENPKGDGPLFSLADLLGDD